MTIEVSDIEEILERIRNIWNEYIFKIKFFHSYFKFDLEKYSNHFGPILDHFKDSLPLISSPDYDIAIHSTYSYNISFLQAIYVQQDLMEEMHKIFVTGFDKGKLKLDSNYSINREIRNELIGHPIRRRNGQLISSVTLNYHPVAGNIEYSRYHKKNNYEFEIISHNREDILDRHKTFLKSNLDIIEGKIHESLEVYLPKIRNLINVYKKGSFSLLVKCVAITYENLGYENYLYKDSDILRVYEMRDLHPRFKLMVEKYLFDVGYTIEYLEGDIYGILKGEKYDYKSYPVEVSQYHYELGKLINKRFSEDFSFYEGMLRERIKNQNKATKELNYLVANIENDIEFYSSWNYLRKILTV